MDDQPQSPVRIVERDGKLVVEDARPKPAASRLRLPKLPVPRWAPVEWGMTLFSHQFAYERLEDDLASVSVEELRGYVDLDARSYDRYYLTREQQAMLGFLSISKYVVIGLVILAGISRFMRDLLNGLSVLVFGLMMMAMFVGSWWIQQQLEPVHGQRIEEDS